MKRLIKWLLNRGRSNLIVTGVVNQQQAPKPKEIKLLHKDNASPHRRSARP